jgi:hypothetical protein
MVGEPPDGKGVSVQEWIRDILKYLSKQIDDNLAFLTKLIDANDSRYTERWKAQEQAILKQEAAQAGYNVAHNGLLADNRKQSEEFTRKFETVLSVSEATSRLSAITDRIVSIEKSHLETSQLLNQHFQLPIHPGALSRMDALEKEVQVLRESQSKNVGKEETNTVNRAQSNWTVERIIVVCIFVADVLLKIFKS